MLFSLQQNMKFFGFYYHAFSVSYFSQERQV